MRRGAETANSRWDNSLAILVGDFLFAHASEVTATLGPDAVGVQARTFARLVKGQVRETIGPRPDDNPLEHYLSVVADKTNRNVVRVMQNIATAVFLPVGVR